MKKSDDNLVKKIKITKNGPYLVSGNVPLAKENIVADKEGTAYEWEKKKDCPKMEKYSLCRCGQTKDSPYCDATHKKVEFDGAETASRKKYDKLAENVEGPELILKDEPILCSTARFCHQGEGTWEETLKSDNKNSKEIAIKSAKECPSGRLVICDKKTGKVMEPEYEKSISIVEDPTENVSGPLWVKGGVLIESSDGNLYETRNRVTLCRCGRSKNKPFCDGTHISIGFKDNS